MSDTMLGAFVCGSVLFAAVCVLLWWAAKFTGYDPTDEETEEIIRRSLEEHRHDSWLP